MKESCLSEAFHIASVKAFFVMLSLRALFHDKLRASKRRLRRLQVPKNTWRGFSQHRFWDKALGFFERSLSTQFVLALDSAMRSAYEESSGLSFDGALSKSRGELQAFDVARGVLRETAEQDESERLRSTFK